MKYPAVVLLVLALAEGLLLGCGHSWGGYSRCSYNGTWQTVDQFNYGSGLNYPFGGFVDADGSVYLAGASVPPAAGSYHGIIRKRSFGGSSFQIIDDFAYSPDIQTDYYSLVYGPKGEFLAFGWGLDAGSKAHTFIRRSLDKGNSWKTIYDLQFVANKSTFPGQKALFLDGAGALFLTGSYDDVGGSTHWFVNKSTDDAQTWVTVDDYIYPGGTNSNGNSVVTDSNGNLFVAGTVKDSGNFGHSLIRRSLDHGATWVTVLDYVFTSGKNTSVGLNPLVIDSNGKMYLVSQGYDAGNKPHMVTLSSADQGASWITLDDVNSGGFGVLGEIIFAGLDYPASVWIGGAAFDAGGHYSYEIRRSTNGLTRDSDTYNPGVTEYALPRTGLMDSQGNLLVGGMSTTGGGTIVSWVVRQLNCGL